MRSIPSAPKTAAVRVRTTRPLSGLFLGGLLLLGCSNSLPAPLARQGNPEDAPVRGGTLELATFGDIRTLDPANAADGLTPQMLEHILTGLVDYDSDGNLHPDLAERWDIEDGGLTYRFFLREGVRFHDGEEVTAEDVKRSSERALHASAPNPFASYFSSIEGFDALRSGARDDLPGVRVEGRYVVSFRLNEPDAMFLRVLALVNLRPVCKSAGRRYADTWMACGAGPFKLVEWTHGHSVTLARHDRYYRPGLPYLDAVRWTLHENPTSQSLKFLRGDLDVILDLPASDVMRFQADARWRPFADKTKGAQVLGEAMNVEVPPFDNVEIRRAVASAIDRDALAKLRPANLSPNGQLIPPGVFGHSRELEGQRYDYHAALEHMRRAGYPYDPERKTGGWPAPIPYLVYRQGLQEFTAQVLAQQLERIGLRLEIRVVNYPTFLALRGRRKGAAFGPGFWLQDFPDGMSFLEPLFHTKSIANDDSNNASFYSNPRFDELVNQARRELDDERRKTLYTEAQRILVNDAPWAFTATWQHFVQRQPYVRGHRLHPMWNHDIARTWLDRAAGRSAARAIFSEHAVHALLGHP
jgi:ABC-type transport system substrate-binding protein